MLTSKGVFILTFATSMLLLSILVVDITAVLASLGVIAIVILDYLLAIKANPLIIPRRDPITVKIKAGSKKTLDFLVYAKKNIALSSSPEWVKVQPDFLVKGENKIKIVLSPKIAQEKVNIKLIASYTSPLGLVDKKTGVTLPVQVTVIPRTIYAIIRALSYLTGGAAETGAGKITLYKEGFEYLGPKPYEPGDDIKRVHWKITARTLKFHIKRFVDLSGSTEIVYDVHVPGSLAADKIASALVTITLYKVREGEMINLVVVNGRKTLPVKVESPRDALLKAIGIAMKTVKIEPSELDVLIRPVASRSVRALASLAMREAEKIYLELRAMSLASKKLFVPDPSTDILLVTSLTGDPQEIIEVHSDASRVNSNLTLIVPSEPWLDSRNPEKMRRRYEKIINYLSSAGIPIIYVK